MEELSVALQRRWDGATRRAEERSGLRTACRLPLSPSPTTCERERRRSLSPVPTAELNGRFTRSLIHHQFILRGSSIKRIIDLIK